MKRHFLLTLLACLLGVQVFALDYSNENSCYNNNYVAEWGKLKLVGNQLCSESGQPVQLRGWSTHGKNWQGECFNGKDDFEGMKKKGANIARIAMYLINGGNKLGKRLHQMDQRSGNVLLGRLAHADSGKP